MAIETKYCCDKCGWKQDHPEEMTELKIMVRSLHRRYIQPVCKAGALWCWKCIRAAGLEPPSVPDTNPPARATIEDLVRGIVQDEMEDSS